MARSKDRGKECLSAYVDCETYWKFVFNAERNGQDTAKRLRKLVEADVEEADNLIRIAEGDEERKKAEHKATEKQIALIYRLRDVVGMPIEAIDEGLTISGANILIHELNAEIAKKAKEE